MGEHLLCKQGVGGSNPLASTNRRTDDRRQKDVWHRGRCRVASSKEIGDSGWGRGGSVARLPSSVIRLIDIVKDVTVASALPALAPLVGGALYHEVFMAELRGRVSRCEGVYAERGLGWGLYLREILRASA